MDDAASIPKRLAANLEALRRQRRLTQAVLGAHAGVPRSTIAHLESGGANPSLDTLSRVAGALRVSLEELLARPRARCELIRAKDLPRAERGHGSVTVLRLLPDPLPGLQMERLELAPKGFMRGVPHIRGTKEYLTCLRGVIRLSVSGETYELAEGDVLAFPGDQPHAYHNPGRLPCAAVSVVALAAPVR